MHYVYRMKLPPRLPRALDRPTDAQLYGFSIFQKVSELPKLAAIAEISVLPLRVKTFLNIQESRKIINCTKFQGRNLK